MKNTAELLYQIRGLARSVVAFVFIYQGLVQSIIINTLSQGNANSAEAYQHASWFLYLDGLIEIGLAVWLILSFSHKKPLWVSISFMLLSILIEILFFDVPMGNALLIIALMVLIYIDFSILDFQRERSDPRNFGKYIRVTRDRMLYEFIKRLELKDLPHLMHTLAQSRVKRHLRNRRQIKRRTESSDAPELTEIQDKTSLKKRAANDRRQSNDELSDEFDRSE